MLLTTLLRELFTSERFARTPESDLIMDAEEAVSAFRRAGEPNGILSGVHAFYTEQACRMIRPGDRVLDLGCGPGQLLASIAALNRDATFTGIDYSGPMIAAGNESLRRAGLRNVELCLDNMTELASVDSGSIDVVLSSMALHHLPDMDALRRCFKAIGRVMAGNARIFLSDFGRLKSLRSVEYFVKRAIPAGEPRLEHDYRESLRAAFSRDEFAAALPAGLRQHISIYSTVVSPMMVVLMAPFPEPARVCTSTAQVFHALPQERRADYRQLRLCFRLGGMPCK